MSRCASFLTGCGVGLLLTVTAALAWTTENRATVAYRQDRVDFTYNWTPPPGQQGAQTGLQTLTFSLPLADVQRGDREFDRFDNAAANEYAYEAVQAAVRRVNTRPGAAVQIRTERTAEGFQIRGFEAGRQAVLDNRRGSLSVARDAEAEAVMTELRAIRDQALKDYVFNNFYMQVDATHIMPDHKRVAERYAPALAPVTAAMRVLTLGLDRRGQINWTLGFLQDIPYDELLNRYTSNGAGFQTPYGLLLNNRGDCDTKSVALAAMLRSLYPGLRLTMVYVPEHAFIGIAVPQERGDYALRLGGVPFVLADPTGPGNLRLGEVDPRALTYLNSGTFSYQEIP